MGTLSVSTLDEDLITCQICLYEFDEENKKPKFLQCSHTICLECFQATRGQVTITCPFCRTCTSKDNRNGAEWILPTNQYVLELLRLNRTQSISMPSTAPVKSVEEETDEQLMLALATIARVMGEEYTLTEMIDVMHQSLLNQQQEQVINTAATNPILQPANEDEQLRLALEMSGREMEQEPLNGAILNQLQRVRRSRDQHPTSRSVDRHGESQRNAVVAAPTIQPTIVPNSTRDDLSNAEMFFFLLFSSSLLCYAFLLIWQLLTFFWYRLHFALGIVFLLVNSAIDSFRVNLFTIFFCLALSYDIFFLFLEMFRFFFCHLELLLVIVFFFFLLVIHLGCVSDQTRHHRTVPLSNTF